MSEPRRLFLLTKSKSQRLLSEIITDDTVTITFPILTDTILLSLWVSTLNPGSLVNATAYSSNNPDGPRVKIIDFPTVNSETAELLLRKAALAMTEILVDIVVTGTATVTMWAKAIDGADTTVSIQGFSSGRASATEVTETPAPILLSSLADRSGMLLKNYSTDKTMFVGFSEDEATLTQGFPVTPGETLSVDLDAGQELWACANSGTIDVRILEGG